MVVIVDLFLRRANFISPLQICCRNFVVLYDFYSIFKLQTRCRKCFLCDQSPSCSPNSRPQNVSSYTATLQDIRFGIISLYLSKNGTLFVIKKCNKLQKCCQIKDKSFVLHKLRCDKLCSIIYKIVGGFYFYCPGNNICGGDKNEK